MMEILNTMLYTARSELSSGGSFDEVAHELFAEKPFRHVGIGRVIKPTNRRLIHSRNKPSSSTYGTYSRSGYDTDSDYGLYVNPAVGSGRSVSHHQRQGNGGHFGSSILRSPYGQQPQQSQWGGFTTYQEQNPYGSPLNIADSAVLSRSGSFSSTGNLSPYGNTKTPMYGSYETYQTGFSNDRSDCTDIKTKKCRSNDDCSCYGLYTCVKGRCRNKSSKAGWGSTADRDGGTWHQRPVANQELGMTAPSSSSSHRRRKPILTSAASSSDNDGGVDPSTKDARRFAQKHNRLLTERKKVIYNGGNNNNAGISSHSSNNKYNNVGAYYNNNGGDNGYYKSYDNNGGYKTYDNVRYNNQNYASRS